MDKVIKRKEIKCPLCGRAHIVEERKGIDVYKDKEYSYRYYYCRYEDESYQYGDMLDEMLFNMRNGIVED